MRRANPRPDDLFWDELAALFRQHFAEAESAAKAAQEKFDEELRRIEVLHRRRARRRLQRRAAGGARAARVAPRHPRTPAEIGDLDSPDRTPNAVALLQRLEIGRHMLCSLQSISDPETAEFTGRFIAEEVVETLERLASEARAKIETFHKDGVGSV